MPSLTSTTWNIIDESRVFPAKFAGHDILTGLPFMAAEPIRLAMVDGVKGAVTQRDLRVLNVRWIDGLSVSDFVLGAARADELVTDSRVLTLRVMAKSGTVTVYRRDGGRWFGPYNAIRSEAQVRAAARKAFALAAEISYADFRALTAVSA